MTRQQRVIVVGAGVIGLSTALALHEAGLAVSVVSAAGTGSGASSTNAGLLVPADSVVWPSPENAKAVPLTLLGLGSKTITVSWHNPSVIIWGTRFVRNCTPALYRRSTTAAHVLSAYSLDVLRGWVKRHRFDFGFETNGVIFLFADEASRAAAVRHRAALVEAGESYDEIEPAKIPELGYGPARRGSPLYALYAKNAGHGDCAAFCRELAKHLHHEGVAVTTNQAVREVLLEGGVATGVRTDAAALPADAVVLCAGIGTRVFARRAGVKTDILPAKGYAATVPLRADAADTVPQVGGVFEAVHVAFSRTRTHLRLSTGAVIGNADSTVTSEARAQLRAAADRLFPHGLDWSNARFEAGHRPMTPHGLPLIGAARVPGLWLNSGHGSLGWTQAAGSADLLACLVTRKPPPIDPRPYSVPPGSSTVRHWEEHS